MADISTIDECPNSPEGYNGAHSEAWVDGDGPCLFCGNDDLNCPRCDEWWPVWWFWTHLLTVALKPSICDVWPGEVERLSDDALLASAGIDPAVELERLYERFPQLRPLREEQ